MKKRAPDMYGAEGQGKKKNFLYGITKGGRRWEVLCDGAKGQNVGGPRTKRPKRQNSVARFTTLGAGSVGNGT